MIDINSTAEITRTIRDFWTNGRKTKITPSGWISANAVCCTHRNERPDRRMRGGLKVEGDTVSYSCFNCKFKANWSPGKSLSMNMKQLLSWMGATDSDINKLAFNVLRVNEGVQTKEYEFSIPKFKATMLPEKSVRLEEGSGITHPKYLDAINYIKSRNIGINDYPFFWSPDRQYASRVIIPYYHSGKIVGWTARAFTKAMPKYLANYPKGYVFNLDRQGYTRKFAVLTEGEIDAIHLDGIALAGSTVNEQQSYLINQLNRDIIVCPDRDKAGRALVDEAIKHKWNVSLPEWSDNSINDISDAVSKYGRVYALHKIIQHAESSPLKIQLRAKKWFKEG